MDTHQAKATIRGPMVSVATPFSADFELDLETLRSNIRFMVERGVRQGQGVLLVAAAGSEFPIVVYNNWWIGDRGWPSATTTVRSARCGRAENRSVPLAQGTTR